VHVLYMFCTYGELTVVKMNDFSPCMCVYVFVYVYVFEADRVKRGWWWWWWWWGGGGGGIRLIDLRVTATIYR